jgi:hypothetical protein
MSSLSYDMAKPKEAHAVSRAFDNNVGIARKGFLFVMEKKEMEGAHRAAGNELGTLIPGIP